MTYLIILIILSGIVFVYSIKTPYRLIGVHFVGRGIIDSSSDYTYINVVANFSIAKIFSVFYIGVFVIYIYVHRYRITGQLFFPIVIYIMAALISSVMAENISGFAQFATKWIYFYLLFTLAYYIGRQHSLGDVAKLLVISSFYPIANQLLYAIIQGPKCITGQEICSYIGSFYHESELASWIFIFIMGASLGIYHHRGIIRRVYVLIFVIGIISMYFNGYRTATIALSVFIILMFLKNIKKIPLLYNLSIVLFLIGMGIIQHESIFSSLNVYLSDIVIFLEDPGAYISLTGQLIDSELFSGRLYLYNQILRLYVNGGLYVYLLGIGPERISTIIGTFAHNEYISTLVEMGIIGLFVFCWFLIRSYYLIKYKQNHIFECMFLSILITALATMPFHDLRAIILMAMVLGIGLGERNKIKRNEL